VATAVDEVVTNMIIAARVMAPYIVLFKPTSLEFHPLIEVYPTTDPYPIQYQFPNVKFVSVSLSDSVLSTEGLCFAFLGNDVLRGIFHFRVSARFLTGRSGDMALDVECIGIYAMSKLRALFLPEANEDGNLSSRGFVSAMTLGPQGKRAVWIERMGRSTLREVLVWSALEAGSGEHREIFIPRRVVYRLNSYDLREDLTDCAFGEISGTIILCNRAGDFLILRPDF